MAEVEIGMGKSARRGWDLDEVSIVPSRRTRDPEDVDISWELDAFRFELPVMAAPTDSVVSPAVAVAMGRLGGVGVLNLEGLWTRHEDPEPLLEELSGLEPDKAAVRLREAYAAPVREDLVVARIAEIKEAGVVAAAAVSPQRTEKLASAVTRADLDLLVIRGPVVSAEHVSRGSDPLNLKTFIRELEVPVVVGGCASYQAALHLMRTGAVAVLVGVGGRGPASTTEVLGVGVPQATAIADAAGARMRHLDETGVYVHIVAEGGLASGGDMARAVACGADAVMVGAPLAAAREAPGRGRHWAAPSGHADLPQAGLVDTPAVGGLEEILVGPAPGSDPRLNLLGSLRASMAACGYETLKEFQKAELTVRAG